MDMDVTLEEILSARDRRAAHEKALLASQRGACLAVFTVVSPGPVKQTADHARLFEAGLAALSKVLLRYELPPLSFERIDPPTGSEAYLLLRTDAAFLKTELCKLEEAFPYGRLWDMDVLAADGTRIAREDVGFSPRGCVVCGKPGRACSSRGLHPPQEVLDACRALAETLPVE